jgi:hypothetical protein
MFGANASAGEQPGEGRCAVLMRLFSLTTLALLALVTVGCSLGETEPPQGTFELPNGRSLYIECLGSGSPTIVVEAGQDMAGAEMFELQQPLARQYMTCTYDRANIGSSGKAPTPRTAAEIVSDLHRLLETADVAGPYVLVGHSAGGFFVQLYGRRYPDEVRGVVAMNPVPPADLWLDRVLPRFNKEERKEEIAYYRGENPEQIDWLASSKELKKAPPPSHKPFAMLLSTKLQCVGGASCLKSYDIYEEVEREVAQQWPEGSYRQVEDAYHEIYSVKPGVVVDTVKRVASK